MTTLHTSKFACTVLRTLCVVLVLFAARLAHAGPEHWPEFWQQRADADTRSVLDRAYRQFTARDEHPQVELYRHATPLLRELLERENAAASADSDTRLRAGRAWMFLGELYANTSDIAECLASERKGLALIQSALPDPSLELAQTLSSVGNTYWVLGKPVEATQPMEQGLRMLDRAGGAQPAEISRRLRNLATVYKALGLYAQALPLLVRRLALIESTSGFDAQAHAMSLGELALAHDALGHDADALALYQRSLDIAQRALGPRHLDVATIENNLAGFYKKTGDYGQALPLYVDALAIRELQLDPNHPDVAVSLNNLALLYEETGRYAQALPLLDRSLAILKSRLGDAAASVATAQNSLAALYNRLGQNDEAIALVRSSLAIRERIFGADSPELATSLNNFAALYNNQHRYLEALPLYQRSLAIREAKYGAYGTSVASTLNSLAALYANLGRDAEALPLLQRSLAIWERTGGIEHAQAAITLCDLAATHVNLGQYSRALTEALRAERIAATSGTPDVAWRAQSLLSTIYANQKQNAPAIFWGKQAVNTLQGLRAGLVRLDEDLQRSFLNDKRHAYSQLASLLVQAGRIPEAQSVMRMLKEQEYFELVRGDSASDPRQTEVPLTGVERAAHERFYEIRDSLAALGKEQEALQARRRAGTLGSTDEARLAAVQDDLAKARDAFSAFVGGLSRQLAARAETAQSVQAIQQQIQTHRTLLNTLGDAKVSVATLQYITSESRLHIILTTTSVQLAREVTIDPKTLNARIVAFRQIVQDPGADPREAGRQLYATLIEPVRKDLEAQGIDTLMLFLDGPLRYVPFAALVQADGTYLIERYRLSVQTDAARTALAQVPARSWQVSAFGVTRPFPDRHFSALTAVRGEIEGIVRDDLLPGQIFLDERFTRPAFESALDAQVLHIGSHFRFLPGSDASFLLLGDGSTLTLHDIASADLRFDSVDLLTLSACETAVGGGLDENGLEVEGLGALAQKQGAKAVLATLWPVADDSTGTLMQQFYRLRQSQQLSKAEALRQAQLHLLRGAGSVDAVAGGTGTRGAARSGSQSSRATYQPPANAPYAHPYYWAPFVLMGNWR